MRVTERDVPEPEEDGAVTFVNRFTLWASSEEFERTFAATAEFMAGQPGFIENTLLRHMDRDDSYLNIARWRDTESFRKAVAHPDFKPHAAALRALSTSEPGLYRPQSTRYAAPETPVRDER